MGKMHLEYLEENNIYVCANCHAHLTHIRELISKGFKGKGGKAYLFDRVVNVKSGPKEERLLLSGVHIVCDLFCRGCNSEVGWKYELAYEESQKYKEGKTILEKVQISKHFWTE